MTGQRTPEMLSEDDLDAAQAGAASGHRRQAPIRFTARLGKTANADGPEAFSSSAGGSPNI
ncbi:MAG: hypothetical protein AAGE80_09445 [Pseudomonadota bacterium]